MFSIITELIQFLWYIRFSVDIIPAEYSPSTCMLFCYHIEYKQDHLYQGLVLV